MGTVLLVDDDLQFRAFIRPVLEGIAQVKVLEVAKGRLAHRVLQTTSVDLIVIDGLLPDTNGVRWIEAYRDAGGRIPIVFVSAFFRDLESFRTLTQRLGVSAVLHKPVDPGELARVVASLVPQAGRTSSAPPQSPRPPPDRAPASRPIGAGASSMIEHIPREERSSEDGFAALRTSYEKVLPHILARLVRVCDRAQRQGDSESVQSALRQAHDLAGTAGGYGFGELGEAAYVVERELRTYQSDGLSDWGPFLGAVATLRTSAFATPPKPPPVPTIPSGDDEPPSVEQPLIFDAADDEERDSWDVALPASAIDPGRSVLLGPRLLILDDDPTLVGYARGALRAGVAMVREASDDVAIEKEAQRVEAALIGVPFGSPDRSRELVHQLRASAPELPIGYIALRDDTGMRRAAVEEGVDLFLAHPLRAADLIRAAGHLDALAQRGPIRVLAMASAPAHIATLRASPALAVEAHDEMRTLLTAIPRVRPHVVLLGPDDTDLGAALVRVAEGGHELVLLAAGSGPPTPAIDAMVPDPADASRFARERGRRLHALRALGHDPVTGLPRRVHLTPRLTARLAEARRHGRAFTLAAVEIDEYSRLLAAHGPMIIERVMATVANLLRSRFRLEDQRGRWTESAFLLGFGGPDAPTMAPALQRLQEDVSGLGIQIGGASLRVSISVGLASAPGAGERLRELVLSAEGRLRVAQRGGPGGIVWAG